jgi:rhodanese-related sulfurtransferase
MTTTKITRAELRDLLHTDVTIVEALPPEYFEQGHIPGAINLPHTEVRERADELLPDKHAPIVVYCANLPCRNSEVAAIVLTKLGYTDVREYAEGKDDWREAGLPLEQGAPVAG